ncbi:phage tail assembly protein [Gilliamella sp. CG16]|uniref:phage tail assembly protein n=1 Tax=Gilliamella sp. CG16 TaxID=3351503 RepID=UPI0039885F43
MEIKLTNGLQIGDERVTTLTLRRLTTGDLLDSEMAAEQVKLTSQGFQLIASAAVMSAELYRRSVAKIGDLDGPLSMGQLKSLSLTDYNLLRNAYDALNNPVVVEVAEYSAEGR